QGGAYYVFRQGEMRNGMIVATFLLSDVDPGDGGFACIPGSHKSNYVRPPAITHCDADTQGLCNPSGRAGDLIIFTEGLTHGTRPWRGGGDRRGVLYRFSAKWVQYGPGVHTVVLPDWAEELTEAQRAALEPAYFYGRPLIRDDGSVERPFVDLDEAPY